MGKYNALWEYVQKSEKESYRQFLATYSIAEIESIWN